MKSKNPPAGKTMAIVKVGERGQIVIPKDARELFNIQPGDHVVVLADINQGIAVMKNEQIMNFALSKINKNIKE